MIKTDLIFDNGERVPIGRKYQDVAQMTFRACFEKLIIREML
jgi:hypothetical protein